MWHGRILGAFGVVIICERIILVPALLSFRSFLKEPGSRLPGCACGLF